MFLLTGCGISDAVYMKESAIVVEVRIVDSDLGKYRYVVRDGSNVDGGFIFYSDIEYRINDRINFVRVEE